MTEPEPNPLSETPIGKLVVNALTAALEAQPAVLASVQSMVEGTGGTGLSEHDRQTHLGKSILALVSELDRVAGALAEHMLSHVNPAALGAWYIGVYDSERRWKLYEWMEPEAQPEADREAMRAGLLEAKDVFDLAYPDEAIVYEYLSAPGTDFGDEGRAYSAYQIARLWQRRFVASYEYADEVADRWLERNDPFRVYSELMEASDEHAKDWLDSVKERFARALIQRNRQLLWMDNTDSGGRLWCYKRHEDTSTALA